MWVWRTLPVMENVPIIIRCMHFCFFPLTQLCIGFLSLFFGLQKEVFILECNKRKSIHHFFFHIKIIMNFKWRSIPFYSYNIELISGPSIECPVEQEEMNREKEREKKSIRNVYTGLVVMANHPSYQILI